MMASNEKYQYFSFIYLFHLTEASTYDIIS